MRRTALRGEVATQNAKIEGLQATANTNNATASGEAVAVVKAKPKLPPVETVDEMNRWYKELTR